MKEIAAAQFKARCLTVMEDVRKTREPVIVTKRGKPVVKLVPIENAKDDFLDRLKGVFEIVGDIESPAVPPEDWNSSW
jgi:prevent-host-death family protein